MSNLFTHNTAAAIKVQDAMSALPADPTNTEIREVVDIETTEQEDMDLMLYGLHYMFRKDRRWNEELRKLFVKGLRMLDDDTVADMFANMEW